MTVWAVPKIDENRPSLGTLKPKEVLFYYDGARLFTIRDRHGRLLLAYECDEDDVIERFLLVPTNPRQLADLRNNRMTLRDALTTQSWAWLVDLDRKGKISILGLVDPLTLPSDSLPVAGVYLNPPRE